MESMIAEIKKATTPEEMRAEIFRLRNYDGLVRRVMDSADYNGMSAEDRYTILAYYALQAKNDALERVIEFARTNPMPQMIVVPNDVIQGPRSGPAGMEG